MSTWNKQRRRASTPNLSKYQKRQKTESDNWNDTAPPFIAHMSIERARELKENDLIDHRDQIGQFLVAKIVKMKGTKCWIEYIGHDPKWNTQSDFEKELERFAEFQSITNRKCHRLHDLRIDSLVGCKFGKESKWKSGIVCKVGGDGNQIKIWFDKNKTQWTHRDNVNEVISFKEFGRLKCGQSKKMNPKTKRNVFTAHQIIKWLNQIENGKYLDVKYRKLKQSILECDINIFRIGSVNALFLRQAQINDEENIKRILSNIESLIKEQSDNIYQKVPLEYFCPISFELMTDPVTLTSGDSYQRSAIEEYLKKYGKDPKTKKEANVSELTTNRALKSLIQTFLSKTSK